MYREESRDSSGLYWLVGIVFAIAFVIFGIYALTAIEKVPAGNVGVKVYLLGGSKGVDMEELGPGRYWIGWNEDLFLFPTFTQNHTWEGDHRIGFQTMEGLAVSADVGISYSIDPHRVPAVFQKYRKGVDEITDIYLRNMVRDSLVKSASVMPVENVYGAGKAKLIEQVQHDVRAQVSDLGIKVEKVYWIGELNLPPVVSKSISNKIQATQMAQQRRNEVEQAKAEAEKMRQTAMGRADARLTMAKADAESIRIRGEALRDNPQLVQLNAVDKWDGHMPRYMLGGATPFINIPGDK